MQPWFFAPLLYQDKSGIQANPPWKLFSWNRDSVIIQMEVDYFNRTTVILTPSHMNIEEQGILNEQSLKI